MKKEEFDIIKETEKEHKHSISRSDIKGHSQCQMGEHKWRKESDTEVACMVCPTALTVKNADEFLIENK